MQSVPRQLQHLLRDTTQAKSQPTKSRTRGAM